MAPSKDSDRKVAEAQARIDARDAERAKILAERRAWWANYYEQLAKATPNQGGATHKKNRRIFARNAFHQ